MEATPPLQQPTAHGKRSGAARRKLRKERQALLDAQFANLEIDPEKGWKLPPELVYYMMHISAPPGDTLFQSDAAREYRRFLSRLSLVCSAWREEARRMIWTCAVLKTDHAIRSFLSGGEKVRLTRQLVFGRGEQEKGAPISAQLVKEVLAATENLEVLAIRSVNDLDPGTLATPNLKTLASPSLRHTVSFKSLPTQIPFHVPFRLQTLDFTSLVWTRKQFPTVVFVALLEATSTYAAVRLADQEDPLLSHHSSKSVMPHFSKSPSSLKALSFGSLPIDFHAPHAFAPFFRQLHQLLHLYMDFALSAILESLPHSLDTFTVIQPPIDGSFEFELSTLRKDTIALSRLRQWRFCSARVESDGAVTFLKECERRSIEVVWDAHEP
ncbi:hypothetical protein BCR35DRAFT_334526 [Leucosporidium creatinivorum]|uniref:F-box domain-containing protein n=1 Tax=Leucosporidium creatinivorum TaxID=106004 RepID=A0A1Y2E5F3_9BASI|nr:hypothetical protein BCR35DRAFT_334526 [Leucosporidium creatinivorum]